MTWNFAYHPMPRVIRPTGDIQCSIDGCPTMLAASSTVKDMRIHLRVHHLQLELDCSEGEDKKTKVPCPVTGCEKMLARTINTKIAAHVLKSHLRATTYVCPKPGCGRQRSSRSQLKRHIARTCYRQGCPEVMKRVLKEGEMMEESAGEEDVEVQPI